MLEGEAPTLGHETQRATPDVACAPASGSRFAVGTTRVRCTATDAAGNIGRGSFLVHVDGAADQLRDLLAAAKNSVLAAKIKAIRARDGCRQDGGCLPRPASVRARRPGEVRRAAARAGAPDRGDSRLLTGSRRPRVPCQACAASPS
jgi:HYR domain